mmetsp:Transcript_56543/g.123965  ORF Transcript_56543/g.123965 Transcript_56543/m.123965 type:complete len:242 (-) Transcript_56543:73-798(-)
MHICACPEDLTAPLEALGVLRPPLRLPVIRDLLHATTPWPLQHGAHVLAPHADGNMPRHARRPLLPLVVEGSGLGFVHPSEHLLCPLLLGVPVAFLDHLAAPVVNYSLQPHLVNARSRITVRLLGLPSATAISRGTLGKLLGVHLAIWSLLAAHHEATRRHVPGPITHLRVHHHAGASLAAEHPTHHLVHVSEHRPHHGIHLFKGAPPSKRLHTKIIEGRAAHGHHLAVVTHTSGSTRRPS